MLETYLPKRHPPHKPPRARFGPILANVDQTRPVFLEFRGRGVTNSQQILPGLSKHSVLIMPRPPTRTLLPGVISRRFGIMARGILPNSREVGKHWTEFGQFCPKMARDRQTLAICWQRRSHSRDPVARARRRAPSPPSRPFPWTAPRLSTRRSWRLAAQKVGRTPAHLGSQQGVLGHLRSACLQETPAALATASSGGKSLGVFFFLRQHSRPQGLWLFVVYFSET